MMKNRRVIFFTTKEKIKDIFDDENTIVDFNAKDNVIYEVIDCDHSYVHIIHDDTEVCLTSIITNSRGYYVFHSKTNNDLTSQMTSEGFWGYQDHNVPIDDNLARGFYSWLFEVGKDTLKNKDKISKEQFDDLWKRFDKSSELKKSLDVLHVIYSGESLTQNFIDRHSATFNQVLEQEINNDLRKFIHDIQTEGYKYNDDQQALLSSLRDLLLNNVV